LRRPWLVSAGWPIRNRRLTDCKDNQVKRPPIRARGQRIFLGKSHGSTEGSPYLSGPSLTHCLSFACSLFFLVISRRKPLPFKGKRRWRARSPKPGGLCGAYQRQSHRLCERRQAVLPPKIRRLTAGSHKGPTPKTRRQGGKWGQKSPVIMFLPPSFCLSGPGGGGLAEATARARASGRLGVRTARRAVPTIRE
jgi:hypothetical protein